MTEDEYPAYLDYFIHDYASEISANYRLSPSDSLARAKQEISETLYEGVNTRGQVLLCIIDTSDNLIGYLWYKPDTLMRTAFIYDFHIFKSRQGQGLGKQTLHAFETHLREKGFNEIRLRVAGDNARARHLYETVGFGVTGINMSKVILN
jgi:ribosomal protein S18 acetylase RimI-like enzyme